MSRFLVVLAAALAAGALALVVQGGGGVHATAQSAAPLQDVWSGSWSVRFKVRKQATGEERQSAGLCCLDVRQITAEEGLALTRAGPFQDFVCSQPGQKLYFDATAPFEFMSGHTGVVPGPGTPTQGARAVFCTDDAAERIRGTFDNDLGAFDLLNEFPVPAGSFLATKSGGLFEGSLSNVQGSFTSPTLTTWEGRCQNGPCALTQRRPRLKVLRVTSASVLAWLITRGRGTGLVLERSDGSRRSLRPSAAAFDLEDGDVVTAHGIEAEVEVIRPDDTVVRLHLYALGHIKAGGDPRFILHRGGRVVAGSFAGFAIGSDFLGPSDLARLHQAGATATTRVTNGRVDLELDPRRRRLVVRSLAGKVQVESAGATLTLPRGKDALATPTGVRRLAAAPDLARVPADAATLTAGSVSLLMPRRITTRSLARARCLGLRLRGVGPAQALVTLLVGTPRKRRAGGQRLVVLRGREDRAVCLGLSAKVRGLPAGAPLAVALGTRAGSRRSLAIRRLVLATV